MKRILILVVAWLALSAVAASAQIGTPTAQANLSLTIPTMLDIAASGSWTIPTPTLVSDLDPGSTLTSTSDVTITTKGNVNYKVTVTAPDFTFTPAVVGDTYTKLASTAAVTNGATTVVLNAAGSIITHNRGANSDNIGANVAVSMADHPGDYTTTVTFTIAAQ